MDQVQRFHGIWEVGPDVVLVRTEEVEVTADRVAAWSRRFGFGVRAVLVDLSGRNLVTSSEMAQLLVWQQELAAAGTEMMLVGLTDAVRVILSILRMDSCIPCCSNIDAAIGMWQKSA